MHTNHHHREDPSLLGLIERLPDEFRELVRQELELAKTELREKAVYFGRNAIYLAIGGVVGYLGLIFLLIALGFLIASGIEALGLSTGMALFLGFLVVSVLGGATGAIVVAKALHAFSSESPVPEKTVQSLSELRHPEQIPIRTQSVQEPAEDPRTSQEIKADVDHIRARLGRELTAVRQKLRFTSLAATTFARIKAHPVRTLTIGVGTALAGWFAVRGARLFGRKRTA